jgi:hypothetical protein
MRITRPVLIASGIILALNFIFNQFPLQVLFAGVKALALLATVYLNGFLALHLCRKTGRSCDYIDYFGVGFVTTTAYFFLISLLHVLNSHTVIIYFLFPLSAGLLLLKDRERRNRFFSDSRTLWRRPPWEWLAFFIPLLYAALPTVFFDTLAYNSALPNFFLQNGGFVSTPQFMFANGFIYHETFLIPAVLLGDEVPRLLHFLIGAVFILAVVDFGCREFQLKKRHVLLWTLLSLPMTLFLITTEKADLATALFIFLAVRKHLAGEYRFSALYWGFAIGCKSFSVIAAAAFFLVAILLDKKLELKRHAHMLLILFLVLLPLLVKNAIFAGNPLFPLLTVHFPNEFWDASRERLVIADLGARIHSWRDLLRAPYEFSFKNIGAGSFVGPIFLIFLPFLLFRKIASHQRILFLFPLLLIIGSSFFGNAMRYVYVAFILLSMVVAAIYEDQCHGVLRSVFAVVILVNLMTGLFMLEGIYEARRVYYQKTPLNEYTATLFPMYKAYQAMNERTPPGTRVLVAGETRGYYLHRPHTIASAYDYSVLKKYIGRAASPEEFVSAIRGDGYDFLLFDLAEFTRLASRYRQLSPPETEKLFGFLRGLQPSSVRDSIYTYKLR